MDPNTTLARMRVRTARAGRAATVRMADARRSADGRHAGRGLMGAPLALAVHSANRKLGGCAATHVAQQSCPRSCPLLNGGGCYAEHGPQGIHTRRLNRAAQGRDARDLARAERRAVANLAPKPGQPLRMGVVGDSRTPSAARERARAASDWRARGGGPVWLYSHAWRSVPRAEYGADISPLASVDDPSEGSEALSAGYAPAAYVEAFPADHWEAGGVQWIACPAQTRGLTCADCRLCTRADQLRNSGRGIAFAAHGSGATKIRERLHADK